MHATCTRASYADKDTSEESNPNALNPFCSAEHTTKSFWCLCTLSGLFIQHFPGILKSSLVLALSFLAAPALAQVECFDRQNSPPTSIVDTHLHFRAFGGKSKDFMETASYLHAAGVQHAVVYGLGQTLPHDSDCTYYLDCPGVPVRPSLQSDFANAIAFSENSDSLKALGVDLKLSMTFADLHDPQSVVDGIALLDREFPDLFQWMGEVNLVKQALFASGHTPVPIDTIAAWAPFMATLRDRNIPLAIHADLGNDHDLTAYLSLFEEVLRRYPENIIIWMHMGLSKELTTIGAREHISILSNLLDTYPKLMIDLSWRIIYDLYFAYDQIRSVYEVFLNKYSYHVLAGTDFVASDNKSLEVYLEELRITSEILRNLNDEAYRNIALGQNYFDLIGGNVSAPQICPN